MKATHDIPVTVTFNEYVPDNEVWIASFGPYEIPGDGATGTGTRLDPYVVRNAYQFDQIFRTSPAKVFHLYPGIFYTRGSWAFDGQAYSLIGNQQSIIGAGSDQTTIRLSVTAERTTSGKPRPDLNVIWAGRFQGSDSSMSVEGITVDGNESAFGSDTVVVGGLRFTGSNCQAIDVVVKNLRASYAPMDCQGTSYPQEGFGIVAANAPAASVHGGSTFEDCKVYVNDRSNYVTAFYMGHRAVNGQLAPSVVNRCRAIAEPNSTPDCQTGFAFNSNVSFRDCGVERGFRSSFYNDTSVVSDVLIDGCSATSHYAGVYISSDGNTYSRIHVRDSVFRFIPRVTPSPTPCIGMTILSPDNVPMGPIVFDGVTFECDGTNKFVAISASSAGLLGVTLMNCVFPNHATINRAGKTPDRIKLCTSMKQDGTPVSILPPMV